MQVLNFIGPTLSIAANILSEVLAVPRAPKIGHDLTPHYSVNGKRGLGSPPPPLPP